MLKNYSIELTDNGTGCKQTLYANINQPDALSLALLGTTNLCSVDNATINSTVSGGVAPYNYQWLPGGSTSANLSISSNTTITSPVVNTLTLTVSDNNGCSTTLPIQITINPSPSSDFVGNNLKGCSPVCASFSLNQAQNPAYTYNWLFTPSNSSANPTLSTQYNPDRCFTQAGSYNVALTVITQEGCSSKINYPNLIQVAESPQAEFYISSNPGSMLEPQISVTNISNYATNYYWDFGDYSNPNSNSSTQVNPSHSYSHEGSYLIAFNSQ